MFKNISVLLFMVLLLAFFISCTEFGLGTTTTQEHNFLDSSYTVSETEDSLTGGEGNSGTTSHKLSVGEDAWNISVTTDLYVDDIYKGTIKPDSWGYITLPEDVYSVKLVVTYNDNSNSYYRTVILDKDVRLDLAKIM